MCKKYGRPIVQYNALSPSILPIGLRCAFVGAEQHDEAVIQSVVSGEYQLVLECCNGSLPGVFGGYCCGRSTSC